MSLNVQPAIIHLELHRLLASVLAERQIADLISGPVDDPELSDDPIIELLWVAEAEISRLLLSSAIMLRSRDDDVKTRETTLAGDVGTLDKGDGKGNQPLDLREACNKIIHARRFEFFEDGHPTQRPTHIVLLKGTYGTPWTAKLDIRYFVREGARLASIY